MNNKQKNTYVRQQITRALLHLLETKKLNEISISELTEEAQIGRVSFYRNFESKEQILRAESRRLLQEWGDLFSEADSEDKYKIHFLSLFDFFREHRDFYTIVYKTGMSEIIVDALLENAQIQAEMTNLEAYLRSFWAYGVYGWILSWIERGMQESAEELLYLFYKAQNTTFQKENL